MLGQLQYIKARGLTFEKAIIDAVEAFAPGQVYVALSRCTTLDGIVLQSKIRPAGLFNDEIIVCFSNRYSSANVLTNELQEAKKNYQLKIILSLFDYSSVAAETKEFVKYLYENKGGLNKESLPWADELIAKISILQTTASKFQIQIDQLFHQDEIPVTNEKLNERLNAGTKYFTNEQNAV